MDSLLTYLLAPITVEEKAPPGEYEAKQTGFLIVQRFHFFNLFFFRAGFLSTVTMVRLLRLMSWGWGRWMKEKVGE